MAQHIARVKELKEIALLDIMQAEELKSISQLVEDDETYMFFQTCIVLFSNSRSTLAHPVNSNTGEPVEVLIA